MADKTVNPFIDIPYAQIPDASNEQSGSVFLGDLRELNIGEGDTVFRADKQGIWLGGKTFDTAVFKVSMSGSVTATDMTLTGGTLKYGKTSFTDSTHDGYFISNLGVYFGKASDTTKFKFTIADGTMDLVGTISGRSSATIAAAINSSGHFVDDRIDTNAQQILAGFSFGVSGAIQIGTYSPGSSGDIRITPTGIVGRNSSNATTFSINASTGAAYFAGELSGAYGTFGTVTAGTIDGCDIFANRFRYKRNTIFYLLGSMDEGWSKSISAGGTITPLGSNQVSMALSSAASETTTLKTQGYGVVLGGTDTQAVLWNFDPDQEFTAKVDISGTNPTIKVRIGDTPSNSASYAGWLFKLVSGVVRPTAYAYNPGGGDTSTTSTITSVNSAQWHKYRITVTKTSAEHYTIKWYIDDVEVHSEAFTHEWTTTTTSFSVALENNVADINETCAIIFSAAQFQQNYQ